MAKPPSLPMGRADSHILQSRGAEPYIMNFYSTNYSTSFTKPSIDFNKSRLNDIPAYSGNSVFKPRSAPEIKKTGFVSNVRPQIYYNENLDQFDNPDMGMICKNNYNTITHIHFQPYKLNDGTEELPVRVTDLTSAYTQTYNHNPLPREVSELFIDSRIKAPYDVLPKHKATLHKINDHNPITNENFGHGPKHMSTEYSTKFVKNDKPEKLNPAVGPKEVSGYSKNKEKEDAITGEPGERWMFANRTTGNSDYKERFVPYVYPKDDTFLPNICNIEKTHESNYTKSFKPSDINPKEDFGNKKSEYKDNFMNKPPLNQRLGDKLGSTQIVGPKEFGGQARCERGYLQTLDDPRRFITNYQIRHFDMNPKGKDREGYVVGGVNGNFDDGYTANNKIHISTSINTTHELKNMDPYQSRSIRATDNFYDDHSHDHKLSQKTSVVTFQDNNPYSIKTSC